MTVEEILKDAGLSEDQIKGLPPAVITGVEKFATESVSLRQQAAADKAAIEEETRRMQSWYNEEVIPSINSNFSEVATAKAQAEFYRTQNEAARASGFVPKDAPGYTTNANPGNQQQQQQRNPEGQFVQTPGTKYVTDEQLYGTLTNATWAMNEYQRLYGQPIPEDIEKIAAEARGNREDFRVHVTKKFKFEEKRQEIQAAKAKEHEDKIRADEREKVIKERAQKYGDNPDVRVPQGASQFSAFRENSNGNKHPGSMSPNERRAHVRKIIHDRVGQQTIQ